MQSDPPNTAPAPETDPAQASSPAIDGDRSDSVRRRLQQLPREVGVVLLATGIAGVLLPGPVGTPFLVAGGLVLAPRLFARADDWVAKRLPKVHREGHRQVERFLDDFEKRYPSGR